MILLAHMLLGAVVGYYTKNIYLAIMLALLCHYFLDLFPHIEYDIKNIKEKNWKKSLPDFLRVGLDFLLGLALIFAFSKNQPMIYVGAIVAIVPDGLTVLSSVAPNKILSAHDWAHIKKIHFLKYKKISNVWRILTQVAATVICITLLR